MVSQILIRVDKELKHKFQRLSMTEQKSVNQKVRELMEEYVKDHSMEAAMRSLWDEIGQSLRKKGYKTSDVNKKIKEVRSGRLESSLIQTSSFHPFLEVFHGRSSTIGFPEKLFCVFPDRSLRNILMSWAAFNLIGKTFCGD